MVARLEFWSVALYQVVHYISSWQGKGCNLALREDPR
jgi:hypothetical protein